MKNKPLDEFKHNICERVDAYKTNEPLQKASRQFFNEIGIGKADYVYNFFWLGVPVIQIPQDLQAMQEIVWDVKPDLIIETGIAWGGSIVHSASMIVLLEACQSITKGHVLGIDVDIRPHNLESLNNHPLKHKFTLIEGSSTSQNVIEQVKLFAQDFRRIMVFLDSNHTHQHVLAELEAYAPLVSPGSYCLVGDTVIEDAPEGMVSERPWGKGSNPKTAVWEYMRLLNEEGRKGADGFPLNFEIDKNIELKIAITGSPDGFLKRIC